MLFFAVEIIVDRTRTAGRTVYNGRYGRAAELIFGLDLIDAGCEIQKRIDVPVYERKRDDFRVFDRSADCCVIVLTSGDVCNRYALLGDEAPTSRTSSTRAVRLA